MEQIDYKKKYEEALENIKKIKAANKDNKELVDFIEYEYPELKESEDEKIRKWLVNTINAVPNDSIEWEKIDKSDVLVWLEKQGEQKSEEEVYNLHNYLYGEQKTVDKVEPKFKVKYAGNEYNVFDIKESSGITFYGIEDDPNHIDYVNAENCEIISGYTIKENGLPYPTKPAVFSEQKPAWSEEDEDALDIAIQIIQNGGDDCAGILDSNKVLIWLKSLKERCVWKPSDADGSTQQCV